MDLVSLKNKIADIVSSEGNTCYEVLLQREGDKFVIEISSSIDFVKVNFALLKKLSELFSTDKIDVDEFYLKGTCDTCDHGCSYTKIITIR